MRECLISSSVLILLLAAARPALRRRVPAGFVYGLWLLALARLALPVRLFSAPVSAAGMVEAAVSAAPQTVTGGSGGPSLWAVLWLTGSSVMALWFLWVNARLSARLRRSRWIYDGGGPVPVYAADVSTPCLYGLLRPVIYLSAETASSPGTAALAVAHERTHLRHGDHIWGFLRLCCLIVYWFDPFVWLAASLSKRDGELCCDEATVRALGEDRRYAYGRALLAQAAVRVRPSERVSGAATMSGGARRMRERLVCILQKPRYSRGIILIAALGALAAAGFTFAGPVRAATMAELSPAWTAPPAAETVPPTEEAAVFTLIPTGLPAAVTPAPTLTPEPTVPPGEASVTEPPAETVYAVTGEDVPAVTAPPAPTPTPPSTVPDPPGPGTTLIFTDEDGTERAVVVTARPEIPQELPDRGTPPPLEQTGASGMIVDRASAMASGGADGPRSPETEGTDTPASTPTPPSTVPDPPGPGTTLIFTDEDGTERVVQVTATPAPVEMP